MGSESTDSRGVALPAGVLALAGELLGVRVVLVGRLAGGETGPSKCATSMAGVWS